MTPKPAGRKRVKVKAWAAVWRGIGKPYVGTVKNTRAEVERALGYGDDRWPGYRVERVTITTEGE